MVKHESICYDLYSYILKKTKKNQTYENTGNRLLQVSDSVNACKTRVKISASSLKSLG